jgi:amino acid transporter
MRTTVPHDTEPVRNDPVFAARPGPPHGALGTFAGVFTPSILTILGIILFLRLGYVVGEAGLGRALLILALANGISVLTSLSLSAVATNLRVKRGGDYYLISRTLGHEFGGAIGLVLFLAQAVSIGFYCIGFAEVMASLSPHIRTLSRPWRQACCLSSPGSAPTGQPVFNTWSWQSWQPHWPRSSPAVWSAGTARCWCRTGQRRRR